MPVSLAIGVWWLRRKIAFQQAGLPYLYRLANFPNICQIRRQCSG
jgi:hypothetical protein